MIDAPEQSIQINKHYAQIKENIVYIYFDGDFTYDDAKALLDFIEKSFGKDLYYAICDITKQGIQTPEARKLLASWTKDKQLCAAAMIGGSPMARAMTLLIGNAIRLFNRKYIAISFAPDLRHAQEWIDEQRRRDSANR